jgi:hypothetical protein
MGVILDKATADDTYATVLVGVTNGDDHDHVGGDGAQINHATLASLTTGDPHTQYQKESEKGQANGYASLDSGGTVPDAQIPAGIIRDTEFDDHSARHENGGADEISIAGLSGEAADAQPPKSHDNANHSTAYQASSEKDSANGYAGLNASSRTTKGVDTTDDLIVDLATKGLVLKDTQGTPHYWRGTVSTLGVLTFADLGTSKP